jgi:hypothetical protein
MPEDPIGRGQLQSPAGNRGAVVVLLQGGVLGHSKNGMEGLSPCIALFGIHRALLYCMLPACPTNGRLLAKRDQGRPFQNDPGCVNTQALSTRIALCIVTSISRSSAEDRAQGIVLPAQVDDYGTDENPGLWEDLLGLDSRLKELDAEIAFLAEKHSVAKPLQQLRVVVGPMIATARWPQLAAQHNSSTAGGWQQPWA